MNNVIPLSTIRSAARKALLGDASTITELEAQELAKAEQWLQHTHQDIISNFDPKVVKLRKKYKVVMAPEALDGLLKAAEGESDDKDSKE